MSGSKSDCVCSEELYINVDGSSVLMGEFCMFFFDGYCMESSVVRYTDRKD